MTLLTIVQDAARGIGLPVPPTVIGNNDNNVARLLRFVTQEGNELIDGFDWTVLHKEKTFSAPPCHSEVHQRKRQRDERSSLRAGQAMARIL